MQLTETIPLDPYIRLSRNGLYLFSIKALDPVSEFACLINQKETMKD